MLQYVDSLTDYVLQGIKRALTAKVSAFFITNLSFIKSKTTTKTLSYRQECMLLHFQI